MFMFTFTPFSQHANQRKKETATMKVSKHSSLSSVIMIKKSCVQNIPHIPS